MALRASILPKESGGLAGERISMAGLEARREKDGLRVKGLLVLGGPSRVAGRERDMFFSFGGPRWVKWAYWKGR